MDISRRKLLVGAAAGATLAPLAAEHAASATETAAAALPPPEESGIDHIVVVMMENRSFDHYMGWLPGADGKQDGTSADDHPHADIRAGQFRGPSLNAFTTPLPEVFLP